MASTEHSGWDLGPETYSSVLNQLPPLEEWSPTEVRNHMQFALAMSHGEDIGDFIESHAVDFGAEFDAHSEEYVSAYQKDAVAALMAVADRVYH